MKKILVSFFLYFLTGFFLLPLPALAGSCYCDQYSQAMGTRKSCDSGTPGVIQPDASYCQNKNGKTESDGQNSFTYSNCVYFESTNCQAVVNGDVQQQTATKSTPVKITPPKLEVNIPGLNFTNLSNDSVDGQGNIHIPFLGQYISAIYKLAMTVGSLLAVIMIILNGFRIVISAGGNEKKVGINNITKSLTGLFILWSSYALLYTINPALTQFKPLGVHYIVPFDYSAVDQNITAASSLSGEAKACTFDETAFSDDNEEIYSAAKGAGIDPLILATILQKENGSSDVASRGSCGEVGATQIMPGTVDMLSGTMNCCTASTRSGSCAQTLSRDQIGRDGGGDPYSFSCASVCGTCMQASRSCVDYFHDPDEGFSRSVQFSALLVKKLYDRAKGDVALTFAAYNGGSVKNVSSQAADYAQKSVQIYNGLCQEYALQQ